MGQNRFKSFLKYSGIYMVTIAAMVVLLLLAAMIPNSAIEQKSKESADILSKQDSFSHLLIQGDRTTDIDDYADTIWLNIAYHLNSERPLYSIMNDTYYDGGNVVEGYRSTVYDNTKPDISYARYWHGSVAFIKFFLVMLNVKQIYRLNAVLIGILTLIVAYMLLRRKEYAMLTAFLLGLISISIYTVPFCMEYTPNFLVMLGMLIAVMVLPEKSHFPLLFLSGMITCYFDFLTTETMTFTIPVLFILVFGIKNHSFTQKKEIFQWMLKGGILWVLGYVLTFATKWVLAMVVLGPESFMTVIESANHRLNSQIAHSMIQQVVGSICRPLAYLNPFGWADTYGEVLVLLVGLLVLGICLFYMYGMQKNKKIDRNQLFVIILLSAVPYVRYIILNSHSYLHAYFVYRAQLIGVMGWSYFFFSQLTIGRKRLK